MYVFFPQETSWIHILPYSKIIERFADTVKPLLIATAVLCYAKQSIGQTHDILLAERIVFQQEHNESAAQRSKTLAQQTLAPQKQTIAGEKYSVSLQQQNISWEKQSALVTQSIENTPQYC